MMKTNGRVQSIDRAANVLECFTKSKAELSLGEISEMLDINKSTLHGIISTLKDHDLIAQDVKTQKYRLGLGLLKFGAFVSESMDINKIAEPILTKLCNQLNETVHMCVLDNKDVVYIAKKESEQSIRIITNIGARIPAYCTGVGKAILAYKSDQTISNHLPEKLESMTENTITDITSLKEELIRTKNQGYSIDNEEYVKGLFCIAAPIFDQNGDVKYAISTSGPTMRMTEEKVERAIEYVREAAVQVSKEMGYKYY